MQAQFPMSVCTDIAICLRILHQTLIDDPSSASSVLQLQQADNGSQQTSHVELGWLKPAGTPDGMPLVEQAEHSHLHPSYPGP